MGTRWLVVGLCVAGAAWLVSGYAERQKEQKAARLTEVPPIGRYYSELGDGLHRAVSELKVWPVPEEAPLYPDGAAARKHIESVLAEAKPKERAAFGERLARVRDSLPNEKDILTFEGKPVDNSTFKAQRDELARISYRFYQIAWPYWEPVLREPPRRRVDALDIANLIAFAAVLVLGVALLRKLRGRARKASTAPDQQAQREEPERLPQRPFFP